MSEDPYLFPGSAVLRNKLDIRDASLLERVERQLVVQRADEGTPSGAFDLGHLQAIHFHLFQDVYAWAGQIRVVELAKGGQGFQPCRYIETGMADVHRRIVAARYFEGWSADRFGEAAAAIIGDVNYVHPFREGNGRTQLLYLRQLANRSGHHLDLTRIRREDWMEASRQAHHANYRAMAACIAAALGPKRDA